jgi:hypothetical protein
MNEITLLRELSERLRQLAITTNDKAEAMINDDVEHAWLCGTSRGYMLASRIISVRASDIEAELMHDIVMQSREMAPAHR